MVEENTLPLAVLSVLFVLCTAQAAESPGFVPDPQSATFVFANDHGIAWETRTLIESTRSYRAQSFTYRYYLQEEIGSRATEIPYQESSTRGSVPVWAFANGIMVLSGYQNVRFVNPGSRTVNRVPLGEIRFKKVDSSGLAVRLAGDAGLVMQTWNLNNQEPLYLVPWNKGRTGLDFDRKFRITDEIGIGVSSSVNLLVWRGEKIVSFRPPSLMVYDLAKKKLTTAELDSYRNDKKTPWWFGEIHNFDGETVIIRNEARVFGYHLASKRQFPIFRKSKGEIVGFKKNFLYLIHYRDKSYDCGSYVFDLVRMDIGTKERKVLISDLGRSKHDGAELVQVVPTREKLHVWVRKSKQWKSFSW